MKAEIRYALLEAWQYCDNEDKSTEFMIEYMQDVSGLDHDSVMDFMSKTTAKERMNHDNKKQNI